MSDEKERDDSSKELTIGYFNPIAAPFLRHDPVKEGDGEEEEPVQALEEERDGEYDPRSFEDLSEEEKKEYMDFVQQDFERRMRDEEQEDDLLKRAMHEKERKEIIKIMDMRRREMLMKVTLDCLKKCQVFKTHPYIPRSNGLFKREERCIETCSRKSFALLGLIDKLNENGEINFGEMVAREFGLSDDL